jgi:hypothetical protein
MPDLLTLDYLPAAERFAADMRTVGQRLLTAADGAVRQTMEDAGAYMDETVPVDTGALSRSRTREYSPRPLTWATDYPLAYALTLEYGGYRSPGPRTVQLAGGDLGAGFLAGAGVYSRQAPLGWVRKALVHMGPTFHERIYAAVREAWTGQPTQAGGTAGIPTVGTGGLAGLFGVAMAE